MTKVGLLLEGFPVQTGQTLRWQRCEVQGEGEQAEWVDHQLILRPTAEDVKQETGCRL